MYNIEEAEFEIIRLNRVIRDNMESYRLLAKEAKALYFTRLEYRQNIFPKDQEKVMQACYPKIASLIAIEKAKLL